jgi:hypothetical protein
MEPHNQAAVIEFGQRENQQEKTQSADNVPARPLVPPFDEPIYTINEAAKILRLSPTQAREIFRNEPGVHDFSNDLGKSRFFRQKRRSQLRIPHTVLVRFWKRTEIREKEIPRQVGNGRRL